MNRDFFYSPFRYPGGKTWLAPLLEKWLEERVDHLVEPFAGGANVGLTAAALGLAAKVTLVELDPAIAAVWKVMLNGQAEDLMDYIRGFRISRKAVAKLLKSHSSSLLDTAVRTLVHNRVSRGGIMAKGAGLLKSGEDGRGLKSRWYARTLAKRIGQIHTLRDRLEFVEGDGLSLLDCYASTCPSESLAFFIDPPYANAGRRLYNYHKVDHERLFKTASRLRGKILMTYDDTDHIRQLACKFSFRLALVPMKSVHHVRKQELLISRDISWLENT